MNARPYILWENNWNDVKKRAYDLAILPWGAIEPHNYHLPFATDAIQSDYIAAQSAAIAWEKGAQPVVLPCIPWGVNTGQTDLKLCLNIFPTTQLLLLNEMIENLKRANINKLLIINSHGGNNFIPLIRELSVKHPEVFVCCIDWWKVCNGELYFDEPGDHAGEMETSVMMQLTPDWVLPLSVAGDGHSRNFTIEGLQKRWAWAQRKWTAITDSTGVGNPKLATREKGEQFLADSIEKIAAFIYDLATTDINNLYEQ